MGFNCGIVGLPNVGKSTIFNALTEAGAASANYPFCTIDPNVGRVDVPDPRLDTITSIVKTNKIVPASMEFVDIAGLVKGASQGEGLGNQFLGHIRSTDAIANVVRCFDSGDITHVDGSVDPLRDIETIQTEQIINIGWTGTHTTMEYLDDLIPVIQKLEHLFNFNFIVISNEAPKYKLKSLQFIKWNKSSEIKDLASIHIGLMPLPNETWAQGKCGFKALQYMALNIPTVASPVGVNTSIIKDGENGFLCESQDEWFDKISLLLSNIEIRQEIGKKGKETIINNYSVAKIGTDYNNLFS